MRPLGFAVALVFPIVFLGGVFVSTDAAGQETPASRVIAKEDVLVRTVKVVLTDKSGKPLRLAPVPADFEVFEDGLSATLVGLDPVFEHTGTRMIPPPEKLEEAARAAAAAATAAGAPAQPAAAPARRLPQVFYIDTAFLARDSVLVTVRGLKGRVDRFLRLGPVEIVVADPQPKVFLALSEDAPTIQEALERLALNVVGRDLVVRLRMQASQAAAGNRSSMTPSPVNALLMEEEKHLLRTVLGRLAGWANTRQGAPGVLYLVSDGFDVSSDFYGESQREDFTRESGSPSREGGSMFAEMTPSAFLGQLLPTSTSPMVDSISALLASRGWIAMPFSLRGYTSAATRNLGGADMLGGYSGRSSRPSQGLVASVALAHPMDPLETYADATGGEVISSVGRIESALDRLSDMWLFTYQVDRPADGKAHRLKIRSRSKDVVVRTARIVSAGTPAEVAGTRALDAILERGSGGDLAIALKIETRTDAKKSRKTRAGRLEVRVKLGDLPRVLEKLGSGEMRVTVAVWEPKTIPFVHHDQKLLESPALHGDVWIYTAPIEWPAAATRYSVFVEELKTGASGSAIATFPAD
jgi:hypothetical protein